MSVTIKIPEGNHPYVCNINGVKYYYAAGSTVEVPDAVAALIQQNASNEFVSDGLTEVAIPKDGASGQVLYRTDYGAKWDALPEELPAVSSTDNGKVLKVVSGEWAMGDAPSGLPTVSASDNGK